MGKGINRRAKAACKSMPFQDSDPSNTSSTWKQKQRAWTFAGLRSLGAPLVPGKGLIRIFPDINISVKKWWSKGILYHYKEKIYMINLHISFLFTSCFLEAFGVHCQGLGLGNFQLLGVQFLFVLTPWKVVFTLVSDNVLPAKLIMDAVGSRWILCWRS